MKTISFAVLVSSMMFSSMSRADVVVGPSLLSFPTETVGMGSPFQDIYIQNQDAVNAVTGLEMAAVGCDPNFQFSSNCETTLAPSETCEILVQFLPTSQGLMECTVRIGATSEQGEADVTLMGQGQI